MSEIIRLIIMIGEIIGFLVLSLFVLHRHYKKCRKEGIMWKMKRYVIYAIISNMLIILFFAFSFPNLKFLSYNKLIYFSIGMIFLYATKILLFIDEYYKENTIFSLTGTGLIIVVVLIIVGSFLDNRVLIQFKECTNKQESIETIYIEDNSYLKKHIISTTILDEEKRKSDEDYIVTTEDTVYILHTDDNKEIKLIEND